ncbi:MAG: IgGFc-binding protein [Deltaproteobacteria bacterium]|jgi:hypothetical protein|nr:IgGFc-binding protein [Deltaproteobacteria bacterium]
MSKLISVNLFMFLLSSLLVFAACDDESTSGFNSSNNINNGECTSGEIVCDGYTAKTCNANEQWVEEDCDKACEEGVGCVACEPGETYCDGDTVVVCNDNQELEVSHDCPAKEACLFGECVNRCREDMLSTSNVGCEFWAVDLDNEAYDSEFGVGDNDAAAQQFAIAIANVNDWPINVEVYKNIAQVGEPVDEVLVTPDNGLPMPVTVPPNDLVQIDLPQREVDGCMGQNGTYEKYSGSGTFVSPHGYRIVTDGPVVAYQFNPIIQQFSNDASILIPKQSLGFNYYVMGWPTANPCGIDMFEQESIPDHTSVTIVGTMENTQVTVYLNHAVMASGGDSGIEIPETAAGEELTFTVNKNDVVNLESLQFVGSMEGCMPPPHDGDFTGTRIASNKPVAVFSSLERGAGLGGAEPPDPPNWDGESCCTDHLEQQMFPTRALGWNFVISRSPVRSSDPSYKEPDIYRVLATEDNTVITTSLASPYDTMTLNAGEFETFHAYDGFVINSQGGAIMVGQFLVSQGYIPQGGIGDPTFVVFPAADQHREEYVYLIPDSFESNYMVLTKPEGGNITIDGVSLGEFQSQCDIAPIGDWDGVTYEQYTCLMDEGVHHVTSSQPFGLTVYGYYNVGSYGYPGGSDINIINPVE